MQVFLSWSGERSKDVAKTLGDWLEKIIQATEPWLSEEDIDKGRRWSRDVDDQLEKSRVGIFCLTPENLPSRWLHFEAGAIAKTKDAYVCTFLLPPLTPAQIEQPLGGFQHTSANKDDVRRLVQTINRAVTQSGEKGALKDAVLEELFNESWPQLERKLKEIAEREIPGAVPRRDQQEILEEILSTVRDQQRILRRVYPDPQGIETLSQALLPSWLTKDDWDSKPVTRGLITEVLLRHSIDKVRRELAEERSVKPESGDEKGDKDKGDKGKDDKDRGDKTTD